MWRGSVERVSRSADWCGLIEGRVRTKISYLHLPRSRRRARAENHNLMFRSTGELMANACVSPRRLFRPYESHASTHAARARARCASFVAHITWICRAFTGVQVSLSTGDAPRSRYGSSKRDGAAEAALSCVRRPSRRPRPCSRIQLTSAAPRACARAGVVVACGSRCCSAAAWCVRPTMSARCTWRRW